MFADKFVPGRGTLGSIAFIAKQKEMIGVAAKDKAEQTPDVGHCVKTFSNVFDKRRNRKKEHSGVTLLDLTRIRLIVPDLSRNFSDHSKEKTNAVKTTTENLDI